MRLKLESIAGERDGAQTLLGGGKTAVAGEVLHGPMKSTRERKIFFGVWVCRCGWTWIWKEIKLEENENRNVGNCTSRSGNWLGLSSEKQKQGNLIF